MYKDEVKTLLQYTKSLEESKDIGIQNETYKSYKFKLNPTKEQKTRLKKYIGAYRFTYNEYVQTNKEKSKIWKDKNPTFTEIRRHVMTTSVERCPELKEVPYNIRELAPREYLSALKIAKKNHPQGKFQMKFKSLKKSNVQTIPIGSRGIKLHSDGLVMYPRSDKSMIAFANSKQAKKFGFDGSLAKKQCKLIYDRGKRSYYLDVPILAKRSEQTMTRTKSLIALDPGVRTFQTGYSPEGEIFETGNNGMTRLCKIAHVIDRIKGKMKRLNPNLTSKVRCRKRRQMRRFMLRMERKIRNLVNEVHWKTIDHLTRNYEIIMIPKFQVSQMVKRLNKKNSRKRRINKSVARRLCMWSHYKFRQRLINKCMDRGVSIVVVNEAYTSKTCTRCGQLNCKLGGSKLFKCPQCSLCIDRDMNGARNILLRNLFT